MLNLLSQGSVFLAATAPTIDLSGVDFAPLVESITTIVPAALGVIIPLLAIRKGISFLMSAVRGA